MFSLLMSSVSIIAINMFLRKRLCRFLYNIFLRYYSNTTLKNITNLLHLSNQKTTSASQN